MHERIKQQKRESYQRNIEKYHEFVPWCIEGKIFDKNESSDLISFNVGLKSEGTGHDITI